MHEHPTVAYGDAFDETHVKHINAWEQVAQSELQAMHADEVIKEVVL